ncbi:MAG: glycosyltransferase family 9 protein, partial [Bacteroidota bacterium]
VDRYLQTTKIFDVQNDHEGLNYFIPPRDHVDLPSHFPGILKNEYVALVIGAQHETKKMPVDKLAEFCRNLNLPVVLLGGPGDKKAGDEIFIKSGKNVKNGCGKFNINQSASIVQQANIVVSHDTGLMHVAAAFKKKIVSLWGNTVPAFGMYPYQPHPSSERFEIQNLPCRPCSKIGFQKCPRGHFKCMNEIDVLEVADRVRRLYQLDQIKAS